MKSYSLPVKLTAYTLIFTLIALMLLLGAELYFRQIGKYSRSHFQFDEQVIWRLKANYRGMKKWGEDHFPLRFNAQGFRGPDFPIAHQPDKARIMVIGDSYTAGLDVRYKDLFTTLFVEQLNQNPERDTSYELLNASSPAWGTDQEYIYWKTEGIQYQPDYLILMIAPNDIREMYKKELITLNHNGQILIRPVVYPEKAIRNWSLANKFATYQYLQKEHFDTHYGHFYDIFVHYPVDFGKEDTTNWDLPLFLKDPFPEVAEARHLFTRLIEDINADCQRMGTQLLLAIIPTKMEFDETLKADKYDPAAVANLVQEVADSANIPYLNLHAHLQQQADPLQLFISWEYHLNEEGNKYLANQLYPFFLANRKALF